MIERTEALVLRVTPFSDTSQIVSWLTEHGCRLVTLVKGALRPKSAFLGQYDLYYTCELLYYAKERDGIHIAKECAPLDARPRLRTDWRASAAASYLCGLIHRVTPPGGQHPELYPLAGRSLDFLCSEGAGPALIHWFELQLLGSLGLSPRLGQCSACGLSPTPAAASCAGVARAGGVMRQRRCPRMRRQFCVAGRARTTRQQPTARPARPINCLCFAIS
ncbi:DNA repair protein RecO, partial [Verrucomicrobiota bacterium]